MKHLASLAFVIPLVGCILSAQGPADTTISTESPAAAVSAGAPTFSAEQLEQLLAPIALYPDALIALILPASANPSDIVLAARFLDSGGLSGQSELQPWDDSVRALAHYPQIVRWMDQNLAWTKQLGEAFMTQPSDVMNAVQRLRERAKAAGTLGSTVQQQVINDGGTILIVPTDPNIIYVPYYDPAVVYGAGPGYYSYAPGNYFTFSTGFATGWWLCYGLDWHRHAVWSVNRGDRERFWREHQRDWHRYNVTPHGDRNRDVHVWQPRTELRVARPSPNRSTQYFTPSASPFDRRRESQSSDPRRDSGTRSWHPPGTVETAAAAPRYFGSNSTTTEAATPTERRFVPRADAWRQSTGRGWQQPAAASVTNPTAPPIVDTRPAPTYTRPTIPDTRAPIVDTRPRVPDTRPSFPTYQSVPASPAAAPANLPPPVRYYEPRSTVPTHYTPPAPPPPPAQPAAAQPPADRQNGRNGDDGRRQPNRP